VQTYPLDTLSSLEGAQQLEKMTCRVIAGPTRDRVLCCKFDSVPQKSHDIKQDPPVATRSPTQDRPPDDDNGRTLDDNSRLEGDESSGEWIVLDMMDEHGMSPHGQCDPGSVIFPLQPMQLSFAFSIAQLLQL
jgi:hypothetical protein